MRNKSRKTLGFTVVEVLVAGVVMSAVLVAAWSVFEVLKRSQLMVAGRSDSRSQVRAAFNRINLEFSRADFILSNRTVVLNGETFVLPSLGNDGLNDETNLDAGFVVAIPQGTLRDPSFDQAYQQNYSVVAIKTIPRPEPDSRNPDARSILFLRWGSVDTPSVPNPTAASINYSGLGEPDLRKVYDTYILPGGFRINPTRPLNAVSMDATFTRDVSAGAGASVDKVDGANVGGIGLATQTERHVLNVVLRNSL